MPDHDAFERRLSDALAAYAEEMPVRVSGAAVAARVAGERRRAWSPFGGAGVSIRQPLPLVAWLVLIGLMLALLAGAVAVGAWLLERSREPVPNHGITYVGMAAVDQPQAVLGDDGYVWLLDASGLVRFDPATGERRTWTATDSLDFLDAAGIAPARGGGAWLISSSGTFRRFDGARLGDAEVLPPGASSLAALTESADGTLWAATDAGLFRRTAGVWAEIPNLPPGWPVGPIADDGSGGLWVATDPASSATLGVGHYDGRTWTAFKPDPAVAPLSDGFTLTSDRSGGFWVGTDSGMVHFDGTAWTQYGAADLGSNGPWMAAVDAEGTTWAATTIQISGPITVARLRHGAWQHWSAQDGLPGLGQAFSTSASIVVTPGGPLLVTPGAVYQLAGDRWTPVWQDAAPPSARVPGLAPAAGLDAWWWTHVGSSASADDTKLWHHSTAGTVQVALPADLTDVRAITLGTGGELWLATGSGLAVLTSGGWSVVDARPAVAVTAAGDGAVWAMGPDGSLRTIRAGPAGWEVSDIPNSATGLPILPGDPGPRLVIDAEGQPWAVPVGAPSWVPVAGVWRHDGTGWSQMPLPDGATPETFFLNLAAAHDGSIWVTLDGTVHKDFPDPAAQVARYHNGHWTTFGTAAGLPDNHASLAITPDGSVWLSTRPGLYRFDEPTGRWRLAIGDHDFGEIVAAPDGALWSLGGGGLRIGSPGN